MKANQEKSHLFVSKNKNTSMEIGLFKIKKHQLKNLLAVSVDNILNFNEHLDGIIKNVSHKLMHYLRYEYRQKTHY